MEIEGIVNNKIVQDSSLHSIVNDVVNDAAPLAVHNRNYIVNNVPADLQVSASGKVISSVLNNLFETTLRHAQNSVILVSAKTYGQMILVQLKSKGSISPALTEDINHASLKAKKSGGVIQLIQYHNDHASIAYCFMNVAGQA